MEKYLLNGNVLLFDDGAKFLIVNDEYALSEYGKVSSLAYEVQHPIRKIKEIYKPLQVCCWYIPAKKQVLWEFWYKSDYMEAMDSFSANGYAKQQTRIYLAILQFKQKYDNEYESKVDNNNWCVCTNGISVFTHKYDAWIPLGAIPFSSRELARDCKNFLKEKGII